MKPQIPLGAESLQGRGGRREVFIARLRHRVAQQERRDRGRRPVHGMGGVAGNVEKDLDVCLGDLDTEVGGKDLSDNDRPLIERVMGLGPILPGSKRRDS